jgi:hypothetical protein
VLESVSLGFLYTVSKDAVRALRRGGRPPTPEQILKQRQRWKSPFEREVRRRHSNELRRDVILRDVKRMDHYPNTDDQKGKHTSPWFRSDLVGTYHRGILIGLGWQGLKRNEEKDEWRYVNYRSGATADINLLLVGRIPYENIEDVDWEGDEYRLFPHIYCHFAARKSGPYESLAFCTERRYPDELPSYVEVARYDQVREPSKTPRIPGYSKMVRDWIRTA